MVKITTIILAVGFIFLQSKIVFSQQGTHQEGTQRPSTEKNDDKEDLNNKEKNTIPPTSANPEPLKRELPKGEPVKGGLSSRVIKAYHSINKSNIAGISESIVVQIKDLDKYWNDSLKSGKKIILYINENPILGIEPQQFNTNELKYELAINDKNIGVWEKILNGNFQSSKKVAITVGREGERPLETDVKDEKAFELFLVSQWTWLCFLGIMIVVFLFLVWAIAKTSLLREKGYPIEPGEKRIFSLGLAQMAFWLYIIFGSFLLLFIVMKQVPTLNTSVLILLGISSATALSSFVINTNKIENEKSLLSNLTSEADMLSERINNLEEELKSDPSRSDQILMQQEKDIKLQRLLEVKKELSSKKRGIKFPKSRGFFRDMVEDNGEANLYRVQIILWTLVLGGIFLYKVIKELSIPEYDATLLSLMGISSGTYIGFKIPEK